MWCAMPVERINLLATQPSPTQPQNADLSGSISLLEALSRCFHRSQTAPLLKSIIR
jgi:hypothetical protein